MAVFFSSSPRYNPVVLIFHPIAFYPSLPSCNSNDNWEVSKRDKDTQSSFECLIPGMKCGPGFGGQSGKGKVGAAVDWTLTVFLGWICWSCSMAPATAPLVWGCGLACFLAVIKVWNNIHNLTHEPAAGRGMTESCIVSVPKGWMDCYIWR